MRSACTQFAILSKHILFLNTFKGKVYMKWDFLHELMPYSPFLQLTKQTAPEWVSFWMSYFTAYCIVTLRQRVIFCVTLRKLH